MGKDSKISWTHHTFNPWIGCVKVSDGCKHCYAEAQNKCWGKDLWGVDKPRQVTSDAYWRQPIAWNRDAERAGARRRVFCASLADVFEDRPDLIEPRARLWNLIAATAALDWLLLTKRPENLLRMVPWMAGNGKPWSNVWLGTSVENQKAADERIPHLLNVPAAVRFLSCEPLLGAVRLDQVENGLHFGESQQWLDALGGRVWDEDRASGYYDITGCEKGRIDWVIVGGESGPGARPMHPDWVRSLRDQCVEAAVGFHFKQWGKYVPTEERTMSPHEDYAFSFGNPQREKVLLHGLRAARMERVGKKSAGRLLDGREWNELPNQTVEE